MKARSVLWRISTLITTVILLSACGSTVVVESPSVVASTARASLHPVAASTPSPGASSTVGPAASSTASPTASSTPSPVAPPTASPPAVSPGPTLAASPSPPDGGVVAHGWPYTSLWGVRDVRFAPDGRVLLEERGGPADQSRVVVLAADGTVPDGWPWTPGETIPGFCCLAAFGPEGSVYLLSSGASGVGIPEISTIHRLSSTGSELPGFPMALPNPCFGLDVAGDGTAFVTCGGETTTVVTAIRPDGSTVAGWPVRLAGGGGIVGFRPDGALVLGLRQHRTSSVSVISPAGRVLPGWPKVFGGQRGVFGGFYDAVAVDGNGRVWITTRRSPAPEQCNGLRTAYSRTTYTVLGLDGHRATGWPLTVSGWASDPLFDAAGRMYATTGSTTGSDRVLGYSPSGKVLPGWPARGVDVAIGCFSGSNPVSGGDGSVVVLSDGRATLVKPNGRVASGWPVRLHAVYASGTGCGPCLTNPVVGQRAIYVAAFGRGFGSPLRIIAIDRKGAMPRAWQRSLGTEGGDLDWLRIAPTGRVWAAVTQSFGTTIYLVAEDQAVGG